MTNFNQQIKRIDHTFEEINKLNINTPYYFVSDSLKKFKNNLELSMGFLKDYTISINDSDNKRAEIINKNFTVDMKSNLNKSIGRFSLDLREIARKESTEAYILVDSLLKDLKSTSFIIYAPSEGGHGGTVSFKEYISVDFGQLSSILNSKINETDSTFEQYLSDKKNNIHLISYNYQDLKMNVFHWCLLYHEAFHIIDKEIMTIDDFKYIENNDDLIKDILNKNKEIMVDILSTIYCGLPYPYSLSQLLEETPEHDLKHLNPIVRLTVVKKCLEELQKEYESIYTLKIKSDGKGEDDFEIIFIDSFNKINKIIDSVQQSLIKGDGEDIEQKEYIENNFSVMYKHARKILDDSNIKCFIELINTTDESVKTRSLTLKKTVEYCSLFIPPVVHPIILFNSLLNVFLQKEIYVKDERIKKTWIRSDKEIADVMLNLLKTSLKKWWATKEYYSVQDT